jgi:hypothetical protein
MLLNVYLAIVLAATALVLGVEHWGRRRLTLIGVSITVPWVLRLLTMFLRPSPARDVLAIACGWMFRISLLLSMGWVMSVVGKPFPFAFWLVSALVGLGLIVQATVFLDHQCPACRGRCLVEQQSVLRVTKRRMLLFTFAWCLSCGARWKRNRRARCGRMPPTRRMTHASA